MKKEEELPITQAKQEILDQIQANDVTIVVGETGSGKTTQIPKFIHSQFPKRKIFITQPRRVAAVSLAKRVAQELQVPVGGLVGYTVRFEDRSTSWNTTLSRVIDSSSHSSSNAEAVATRIHFVTDGMLLRFLVSDELLLGCSFLILDEVHERSVRTDILFGLVKQIMRVRNSAASRRSSNPLKLVIMSATMNAQKFASFFNNDDSSSSLSTKILYVPGRQFPVQIYYTPTPVPNYVDATITTILQIHQSDPSSTVVPKVEAGKVLNAECMTSDWNSTRVASQVSSSSSKSSSSSTNSGDVLVFLTGQEEIESCASILKECARTNPHICSSLLICPLYASMPSHQQAAVFDATPAGMRKIVLATNVAETSITIPGIRHVIDCGLAKTRGYNARVGMESLSVQPVSRAAARQRSGRAGRESPGTTYRLYTEDCYWSDLEEDSVPEILRCALSTVILMLKAIKINSKSNSGSSKRIKDASQQKEEDDIFDFPFLDRPPLDALKKALAELYLVNALDANGALTKLGRQMALFPLEPKLSRVLLASLESGVSAEVISIIALLSVENIFIFSNSHQEQDDDADDNGKFMQARQKFSSPFGDHLTLLNVLAAYEDHNNNNNNSTAGKQTYRIVESKRDWCARHLIHHKSMQQVVQVKQQLQDLVSQSQSSQPQSQSQSQLMHSDRIEQILKCFLCGFKHNIAVAVAGSVGNMYKVVGTGQHVHIHPSSSLIGKKAPLILYTELVQTTKMYVRGVSRIEPFWIKAGGGGSGSDGRLVDGRDGGR